MVRKVIKIVVQLGGLYLFYLVGTWIQHTLHLFVPGSIIGMFLLFLLLMTGLVKRHWLESGAELLLDYFPLLFHPAVIGVMNYLAFFQGEGLWTVAIIFISTVIVMCSSGWTAQWIARRKEPTNDEVDHRDTGHHCHHRPFPGDETPL